MTEINTQRMLEWLKEKIEHPILRGHENTRIVAAIFARIVAADQPAQANHAAMRTALVNAVAALKAIYELVERCEAAGGPMSISGISACHAMLRSLRKNYSRLNELVIKPAQSALGAPNDQR